MSTSAKFQVSRHSTRCMVQQLHKHKFDQRESVMECRNQAESLSAAGIAFAKETAEGGEQHKILETAAGGRADAAEAAGGGGAFPEAPPLCFTEVASELDIKHNLAMSGPLSGVAVAVSTALDVPEFRSCSGFEAPPLRDAARHEFPLISWLRRQGACFVGKLSCRSPLALDEGSIFGSEKPASIAVSRGACHYSISCSLLSPPSISCCVGDDVVGFKPTAQTFGTFTEDYKLWIPSMTLGITAHGVDDLLYLWQVYTAAIDPVGSATPADETVPTDQGNRKTAPVAGSAETTTGAVGRTNDRTAQGEGMAGGAASSVASAPAPTADRQAPPKTSSSEGSPPSAKPAAADAPLTSTMRELGEERLMGYVRSTSSLASDLEGDLTPKYPRPEILDQNPNSYTVHDPRGRIADIDVGWRDYNAESSCMDDLGHQPRPGWWQRLRNGGQLHVSPRVELTVGYPADWIEAYCKKLYGTPEEFHKYLADSVYHRSLMHNNQKMEIVPLTFDYEIEDVMKAVTIIANYELGRAFDRPLQGVPVVTRGTAIQVEEKPLVDAVSTIPHILHNGSGGTTPEELKVSTTGTATRPNTVHTLPGALDDMPVEIVNAIAEGQRLTQADYNRALRMRDEVVRVNGEQFQDVDVLVVPLLSEPYASGSVDSIRPTLPFHLAGNPMLSTPMDGGAPVVLVGEHGRDAALLEDTLCFLQFVRGTSPKRWRQKVFGAWEGKRREATETAPR